MKNLDIFFRGQEGLDVEKIHEKLPNALCLFSKDLSEVRQLIKGELASKRGFSEEEIGNQSVSDIFTSESLEILKSLLEQEIVLDNLSNTDKNRVRTIELKMQCKDGSTIWTENQISFIHDTDGNLESFLFITRDISKRKLEIEKKELALKVLECLNRDEDVEKTIEEIIAMIRQEMNISSLLFIPGGSYESAELEENNENPTISIPIKVHSGIMGVVKMDETESAFLDKDMMTFFERIISSISIALERNSEREQLRHSERINSIGKLAGGVAHDFNNLLFAIIGYAEMLELECEDLSPDAKEYVEEILSAANRAAELTKQLLAFGRKQLLMPDRLCVNEVIKDFEKMLSRLVGPQIIFNFNPAEDLHNVHVDKTQFEQIIMNLVVNARDAMPEGGEINLITQNKTLENEQIIGYEFLTAGEYVSIKVSDTGTGIPENLIKNIFEPFFTTKPLYKGSGLGLSVVHGIIKQHHGHIIVESKMGEGATFEILLPAMSVQPMGFSDKNDI